MVAGNDSFDVDKAKKRCTVYRRRIIELSQLVTALHIGPAFSSTEMVDLIYNEFMHFDVDNKSRDTFVMSKGHGCMIQYVILEDKQILSKHALDNFCKADGILGAHPDYGSPGIAASTGSLGHGLGLCIGMAHAQAVREIPGNFYCVISDGELQEGSTWEAALMARSLNLKNLIVFVDNNDFQSFSRMSEIHPGFYPIVDKFINFGWEAYEVDGHDQLSIYNVVKNRIGDKPLMVVCKTIKGKGVSFMENVPMWHFRSPNKDEYKIALSELENR